MEKEKIWFQQQHIKDVPTWEKKRGKNAKILTIVKLNYADGHTKYIQTTAKEIWKLIRHKPYDPVRLTWDEVQGFEKEDY